LLAEKDWQLVLSRPEGVFPFLDSRFSISGSAVVDQDPVFGFKSQVGHNESDTGKEFPQMPLDFAHHSPWLEPAIRLVLELDHLHVHPALGRRPGWSLEVAFDESL